MFVENKYISHSKCYKVITKAFNSLLQQRFKESGDRAYVNTNTVLNLSRLYPMFVLKIECKPSEYYIIFEDDRGTVVFKVSCTFSENLSS